MLGLLAPLPRTNCWTIAEQAGDGTPDGMRHLLARARWDADGVRDDVRSFIVSAVLWQEGYLQGRSGRRICALLRAASARAIVQ